MKETFSFSISIVINFFSILFSINFAVLLVDPPLNFHSIQLKTSIIFQQAQSHKKTQIQRLGICLILYRTNFFSNFKYLGHLNAEKINFKIGTSDVKRWIKELHLKSKHFSFLGSDIPSGANSPIPVQELCLRKCVEDALFKALQVVYYQTNLIAELSWARVQFILYTFFVYFLYILILYYLCFWKDFRILNIKELLIFSLP